jgi:hypothetical protein
VITPESPPFGRNPEASGIINGHRTMTVNGFQSWDMRELGNIRHGDACRLSRFSLGEVVPNVWERVSKAPVDVQVVNTQAFDDCGLLGPPGT